MHCSKLRTDSSRSGFRRTLLLRHKARSSIHPFFHLFVTFSSARASAYVTSFSAVVLSRHFILLCSLVLRTQAFAIIVSRLPVAQWLLLWPTQLEQARYVVLVFFHNSTGNSSYKSFTVSLPSVGPDDQLLLFEIGQTFANTGISQVEPELPRKLFFFTAFLSVSPNLGNVCTISTGLYLSLHICRQRMESKTKQQRKKINQTLREPSSQ